MSKNQDTDIDYGNFAVQGFEYKTYEFLFDFKKTNTESEQSFNGISSYFGKISIFNLTRQNFLAYLHFYSSYNKAYKDFFDEYKAICMRLDGEIAKYLDDVEDMKGIDKVYVNLIKWHYEEVEKVVFEDSPERLFCLSDLYLTFFNNYIYFKKYSIGYSFHFETEGKDYYANMVRTSYPLRPDTPRLNCVEFDKVQSLKDNFRLYPFIPLDVNPQEPEIKLAIFGNNKWVSPIEFAFPYHNEKKPKYLYSVNSFDVRKSIKDLTKAKITVDVEASVNYYYFNGMLFPASASEQKIKGKLVLIRQNADVGDQLMVGVPLFNSGPEWVEKPLPKL